MTTSRTNRSTGALGEDVACAHLRRAGLEVLARNWRVARGDLRGELDVVALDRGASTLVVVEVKTRRHPGRGGPLGAVSPDKLRRLRRLAAAMLHDLDLPPTRHVRIDVIGVVLDDDDRPRRLEHVRGAN